MARKCARVVLLAHAMTFINKIAVITWVIFLTTMVIFYYIRKCALTLVRAHYDVYTIMAEIEERDNARPAHIFTTPTRAIAHFLQLFSENREKMKLTTEYNLDPVSALLTQLLP